MNKIILLSFSILSLTFFWSCTDLHEPVETLITLPVAETQNGNQSEIVTTPVQNTPVSGTYVISGMPDWWGNDGVLCLVYIYDSTDTLITTLEGSYDSSALTLTFSYENEFSYVILSRKGDSGEWNHTAHITLTDGSGSYAEQ
ncbi:MAG: hypothetical protein K6F15_03605 [Treponema sp.]|nr:hypothetical protein [Treponema sp.]